MDSRRVKQSSASEKEVILRAWKVSDDVAIIKDVATKGIYVDMCIEYLAKKRKTTKEESQKYFTNHVNLYVNRLLKDKLVYKAENVLQNVGRNVEHVYFQFAQSTGDMIVKTCILDHLQKRDPEHFNERAKEYSVYCRLLSEILKNESFHRSVTQTIGEMKLENLYMHGDDYCKLLITTAYYKLKLDWLIPLLDRKQVWKYLVSKGDTTELLIWTQIFYSKKSNLDIEIDAKTAVIYSDWEIEHDMFMEALSIPKATEALRNAFAANGYIFPDEKGNVKKTLLRLFTTESFYRNRSLVEELPLLEHILENDAYRILLEKEISCSQLENLKTNFPNRADVIDFIITLKSSNLNDQFEIVKVSKAISQYLQKRSPNEYTESPVVRLFELLASNADVDEIEKPENEMVLTNLPYVAEVVKRYRSPQPKCSVTMEDFLLKFNKINIRKVAEDCGDQPVNFSNEILSRKYAPKVQLNYCDFIRQNRSAYATYCFLVEQFSNYGRISKSQLSIAANHVTEMALKNSTNSDLVVSCLSFIEMLGFDTKAIRAYLKLNRMVCDSNNSEPIIPEKLISEAELKLFSSLRETSADEFPVRSYGAIVTIAKSLQGSTWPEFYLSKIAAEDNWLHFLLFAQYFDIPLNYLNKFAKMFKTKEIGEHLMRAISLDDPQDKPKRRQSFSRGESKGKTKSNGDDKNTQTTSMDTFTSSSSSDASQLQKSRNQLKILQQFQEKDIFALIILSGSEISEEDITSYEKYLQLMAEDQQYCMSINLMRNAVKYDLPILSILSAVMNDRNVEWCWATWLATSMGHWKKFATCATEQEMSLLLIEKSVKLKYVRTLHQSFQIFFKENDFNSMTKFLLDTSERNFSEEAVANVRFYFQSISNEAINLPLADSAHFSLNDFSIKLIFLHLQNNFTSSYYRRIFLDIICRADLSRPRHDFELLKKVLDIIMSTSAKIDYESLISKPGHTIRNECKRICSFLESILEFDKAIQVAALLNMTISGIVYAKWIHNIENNPGDLKFNEYERETELYILPPEILINFYLYVSTKDFITIKQKYHILKKALDVIKGNHLLPNESFDRDNIECEMILTYLENDLNLDDLDIYHSKYYEKVLVQERCVLYKSFPELKELAGVDRIKIKKIELAENMRLKLELLINRLLDDGDVVQALRQQAMFDYRPIDLHFIVFCMAMAEGITQIYNLPNNLRQLLVEVENNVLSFNKRPLGKSKSQLIVSTDGSIASSSSSSKQSEIVESTSHLEFEEIPSREKQEILKALQGIVSRLKHGVNIGKRIMMVFRAAMHLDKEYLDVLKTKDALFLLRNAIEEDCLEKLVVISDIFMSSQMTNNEIADFLSAEIATAVIRPRFYILSPTLPSIQNNLWGLDLEKNFHLILELSSNRITLGNCLLDYCDALKVFRKYQDNKDYESDLEENQQIVNAFDSLRDIIRRYGFPSNHAGTSQVLSHKKQNTIYIELLIKAHECFEHELSMEGIANILNRAKSLTSVLSNAKSWNLIVRMLTGIGRYREMYYCIDTLISNDQFESLLGQFDEEKAKGLRQAIIQYIRERCPQNRDYYRLTALHFSMFNELAEMWETEGKSIFAQIISNYQIVAKDVNMPKMPEDNKTYEKAKLRCSDELLAEISKAMENFTHATENYLMDNKMSLAQKSVAQAELAAMQYHLVSAALAANEESCICVLSIHKDSVFRELVNNDLNVPQSLILHRAYSIEINWSEAILNQYILLERGSYIDDYCNHLDLSDNIIENVVKSFQLLANVTPTMEENMSNIVEAVQSITLRYKLASLLGFRKIITALINDQSLYYLKDTNYGRNEIDFS